MNNQNHLSDKPAKIKKYGYKDIFMSNYGDPLYDKDNKLLGYKINDSEFASVVTYYNNDNLMCNKVWVRDITELNKALKGSILISWLDIKTDFGFIREYSKKKYFYDLNNNLINVEVEYNYPSFPIQKKDASLDLKIGSLDLETYGSNFGTAHHKVYAGAWAVKNNYQPYYIKINESSEQLINRIFLNILMNPKFDGYIFYVHTVNRLGDLTQFL
jgi:hypothetical protein